MSHPLPPTPQKQSHPSLPARPPVSASGNGGSFSFKPRNIAAPPTYNAPATYSAPHMYHNNMNNGFPQPPPQYMSQPFHYQQAPAPEYGQPSPPQMTNPFATPSQFPGGRHGLTEEEQEMQAQIAQWQSAYAGSNDQSNNKSANVSSNAGAQPIGPSRQDNSGEKSTEKPKTVLRTGGGQEWQDSSLLEWDPSHFRLFVGNLAGEVSDDSLLKAFQQYPSVQKARVVRDKRTTKSKGFGFISFSNMDDYYKAAKDMQGKYIGSHPVILRAAKTDVRPSAVPDKNKHKGKGGHGPDSEKAKTKAGVKKNKKKDGVKMLG